MINPKNVTHAQTDPADQFSATSDCYPVGPVGLDARGGPVGPDVYFTNPNLLTHVIWTPPDPDGQDTTTGPGWPSSQFALEDATEEDLIHKLVMSPV